jgi:hypothetical protein
VVETALGLITLAGDLERDVGTDPLIGVLGEVEVGVQDVPDDLLGEAELGDALLGVEDALVAIGELFTELVGASFELARLPSANVGDGGEGLFGRLVDDEGGGVVLARHDGVPVRL